MGFSLKNVLKSVGLTKANLSKVVPIIGAINPIAGIITGGLTGGISGAVSGLAGAALGSVLTKVPLLSAGGRVAAIKTAISGMVSNPSKLVTNTIAAGGDITKGLTTTLLGQGLSGTDVSSAIKQMGSLGTLNLSDFGVNDAVGLKALYDVITSKPIDFDENVVNSINTWVANNYTSKGRLYKKDSSGKTVKDANGNPVYDTDSEVYQMWKANSDILDDAQKEAIINAQQDMNARGMYRSGLLLEEERKTRAEYGKQKAKMAADLDNSALEYNNIQRAQAYNDLMKRYEIRAAQDAAQKEGLSNIAAQWMAGQNGGGVTNITNNTTGNTGTNSSGVLSAEAVSGIADAYISDPSSIMPINGGRLIDPGSNDPQNLA